MNNLEKYETAAFIKQSNVFKNFLSKLKGGYKNIMGSRGEYVKSEPYGLHFPTGKTMGPSENLLWDAKGVKGLSRFKLKQNPRDIELNSSSLQDGFSPSRNRWTDFEPTPLANLLKGLAQYGTVGGMGAGAGYAMKKGLDADQELGPPYNYNGNPNE